MTSPADEVRRLMARYTTNPARTRAFLDAALPGTPEPEPTAAELAASVLGRLGFTAEDIRQGIAEGGSVEVEVWAFDPKAGGDPEATP